MVEVMCLALPHALVCSGRRMSFTFSGAIDIQRHVVMRLEPCLLSLDSTSRSHLRPCYLTYAILESSRSGDN